MYIRSTCLKATQVIRTLTIVDRAHFTLFLPLFCTMCSAQTLDLETPRNAYLTAFYKRSFAYHTVKNRMPVILTQTIDGLVRNKEQIAAQFGEEGQQDLKSVICELSKLKYEIQTNKSLRLIESNASDVEFYNNYITELMNKEGNVTFFGTIWLLAECYMYRRIREGFELTKTLRNYDPFKQQKQNAFFQAQELMSKLGEYLSVAQATEKDFVNLLKINLWGNKCDLSLSNGKQVSNMETFFDVSTFEANILSDHSKKIWQAVAQGNKIIDIVFDNSGYELFTDLCLADYLTSKKLVTAVRFYVKSIPWFISDVTIPDFNWTLDQLTQSKNDTLKELGLKWRGYVDCQKWILVNDFFWTLPVDFTYMRGLRPDLYKKLGEAGLVIFKGDLNYRKLFGEKNWDPTSDVDEALQNFHPAKLCTLRTIKADIVCGLEAGVAEKIQQINSKWMETGDYGLIQYSDKIIPL